MENMDKGLTVPKWVLILRLKIPQRFQNLSAQLVCPSPKVLDFNEKRLHWASVVRGSFYGQTFNRFALLKIVCSLRAALMQARLHQLALLLSQHLFITKREKKTMVRKPNLLWNVNKVTVIGFLTVLFFYKVNYLGFLNCQDIDLLNSVQTRSSQILVKRKV